MLPRSSRALLLLCAGIFGGLGLAAPPEKEELWETWMRLVLDETPMVQDLKDIAQRMGNGSSQGAAELREGHQIVPSHLHQEQEGPRDVHPRRGCDLLLQQVMEKLQRLNQSLELTLEALEDTRSRLENHLEHLKAVPSPDGQSPGVTSTLIPHGAFSVLLVLLVVPAPLRVILLLLFLVSSTLGMPEVSALLVLAVAGRWLVASRGIQPGFSREKHHHRLTSTPERECDLELLQEELDRLQMSCVREPSKLEQPQEVARDVPGSVGWEPPVPGGWRMRRSSGGAMPEPLTDTGKHREPKPFIPRATTSPLSPRSPCRALTRAGQRCRKKGIPGKDLCHIHAPGSSLATDSSPHFEPPPPP